MPQPDPAGRWNSPERIAFRAASGGDLFFYLGAQALVTVDLVFGPEPACRAAALALAGDLVVYSTNTGMQETLDQIGSDRDRPPIGRV